MYQLLLLLHRETDNLSIGQCWHTLHNSHLHHKYNRHYWLHHCNGHFQPALHNHNLKIGENYIYLCCIIIDNFSGHFSVPPLNPVMVAITSCTSDYSKQLFHKNTYNKNLKKLTQKQYQIQFYSNMIQMNTVFPHIRPSLE